MRAWAGVVAVAIAKEWSEEVFEGFVYWSMWDIRVWAVSKMRGEA